MEDHFGANINRITIAKGNAGRLAYMNEFVEEAKASGLVQRAIAKSNKETGMKQVENAVK